jgi:hypothetical protein
MSAARMRPSFFIVGANKCGTSSLYRYLLDHPGVLPCAEKEPNFFGVHSADYIRTHIDEYFSLFPTEEFSGPVTFECESADEAGSPPATATVNRTRHGSYITGEASANTFHEVSPALLHRHLPETKLIVLVRNPVDRACSHHRMYKRFADSGYDLGFPVGELKEDIRAELEAHERGERTQYVYPGLYFDLLGKWVAEYGTGQVKVMVMEDISAPRLARRAMCELEAYLGLPSHDYGDILAQRFNRAPPAEMDPSVRSSLAAFYRPHNERLERLLRRELCWG